MSFDLCKIKLTTVFANTLLDYSEEVNRKLMTNKTSYLG